MFGWLEFVGGVGGFRRAASFSVSGGDAAPSLSSNKIIPPTLGLRRCPQVVGVPDELGNVVVQRLERGFMGIHHVS